MDRKDITLTEFTLSVKVKDDGTIYLYSVTDDAHICDFASYNDAIKNIGTFSNHAAAILHLKQNEINPE